MKATTTQSVLEDMIRHMCLESGADPAKAIASLRQTFPGQFNHPARPEVIAMAKAEKQETTDFVKGLENLTGKPGPRRNRP